MDYERVKLIEHWVYKLNKAIQLGEAEFNYQKDLMTDDLDYTECEEVFSIINNPIYTSI